MELWRMRLTIELWRRGGGGEGEDLCSLQQSTLSAKDDW